MRHLLETLAGIWELLLLAIKARFRLRSSYWRWRYETAFGSNLATRPAKFEQLKAVLSYGRWVYRMKRGR